jgi:Flp pilus assembly protein protease CpaA
MTHFFDRHPFDLQFYGHEYRFYIEVFYIEVALVAVMFYVGYTDFRSFKIRNNVLLLLLLLYVLFALVARTPPEILSNVIFAAIIFAVLALFYTKGVIGGGDVKLVSIVCLWVGVHCALLFSLLLLLFIGLHLVAAWLGWADTKPLAGRFAIPYAPSVAGALIITVMAGCL